MLTERGIPSILCSGYAASNMIPDAFKQTPQIAKPYDEAILRRDDGPRIPGDRGRL